MDSSTFLVEIPRPLASDEEAKVETFMKVREVSRAVALKFLLGRKMDVERAHLLLNNYNRAILERHFDKITITDVVNELRTEKMFIPGGKDRNGAAVFVVDLTKHEPEKFTRDDTIRLAFYMGEKATERPTVWANGLTLIVNLCGFTWAQFDLSLSQDILGMFTDNIPARVKNILLFDPPWWISAMVKLVSPFMKEKMRSRLQVCNKDTIKNYLAMEQTPELFGGTLAYDHELFIKHCIEDVGDDIFRQKLHLDETGREISAVPLEVLQKAVEPAGPKIEIDKAVAEALEKEREEALRLIDQRLISLKEKIKINKEAGKDPARCLHLLRYRGTRQNLDMSAFHSTLINSVEPNRRPARSGEDELAGSAIREKSEDDYDDPEALKERIKRDIKRSIAVKNSQDPETEEVGEDKVNLAEAGPDTVNVELDKRRRRSSRAERRAARTQPIILNPDELPHPNMIVSPNTQTSSAEASPTVSTTTEITILTGPTPETAPEQAKTEETVEELTPSPVITFEEAETVVTPSKAPRTNKEVQPLSPESPAEAQEEIERHALEVDDSVLGGSGRRRRRAARTDNAAKGRRNFHLESRDELLQS